VQTTLGQPSMLAMCDATTAACISAAMCACTVDMPGLIVLHFCQRHNNMGVVDGLTVREWRDGAALSNFHPLLLSTT
jgi:hypothetical protein